MYHCACVPGLGPAGGPWPLSRRQLLVGVPPLLTVPFIASSSNGQVLSTGPCSSPAPGDRVIAAPSYLLPGPQPEPVAFPRRRLSRAFAVLLLRSGYDAVDSLDFIPMDTFQKDFWLLRRSQWEGYSLQSRLTGPMSQGDLTDPHYFDFISAVQVGTVEEAMRHGQQTFEEACGPEQCDNDKRFIVRDPVFRENSSLPGAWEHRVGDAIYSGLREGFQGVPFRGVPEPLDSSAPHSTIVTAVTQLLDVFVNGGYALSAEVRDVDSGTGTFTVSLNGPATLWALQGMAARQGTLYPAHDALAIAALLRASGRRRVECKLAWTDTTVTEKWTILC